MSQDPLDFDFGLGFQSMAERVIGERAGRVSLGERALPFNHAFLDDYLRAILPNDLLLIGADTGAGKTELARWIAASNAHQGRRVYYFALEAEPLEIERRTKFQIICEMAAAEGLRIAGGINYIDWYRGALERQLGDLNAEAEQVFRDRFKTLFTYYRGSRFDHATIEKLFLAHQSQADLFVLDHLHYVDVDDDDENRGFKHLVKTIRDIAISIGKSVIVVVHLKKPDQRARRLVPHISDVHGSSDITKISTDTVLLSPAWSVPSRDHNVSNTFFSIQKAREAGATNLLALCPFDRRRRCYADHYTIGREEKGKFEPLGTSEVPGWAHRHQPMSVPMKEVEDWT